MNSNGEKSVTGCRPNLRNIRDQTLCIIFQFALDGSQHKAILHVAELVQGTYTFVLKVTNVRGKSSEDKVLVTVLPDPLTANLVSYCVASCVP